MTQQPPPGARQLWQLLEPVHATLYYAPEAAEEVRALGYGTDERWPSYFALRAAPLGAASPELVAATFYSFNPEMVRRYVADAWETASPEAVLRARLIAVDRSLRSLLGDRVESPELREAAALARRAAEAADTAGRPLAAANAAQPWPDDDQPHLTLWQAAIILREHRGDGHIAALLAHGLDGVESLVSHAAMGAAPEEVFGSRDWSPEQWSAARERLTARGWLDSSGALTDHGRASRTAVEHLTDDLAAAPWRVLGPDATARLAELLLPPVLDLVHARIFPTQTTLGIGLSYE